MKTFTALTALTLAVLSGLAHADRLDDIKKSGVLRVASFDSNPPFGFVDAKSKQIEGLDVDYAKAIADKLGVKLQLQPTNPANRVPLVVANKVDLVLANFTITPERAEQVNFSIPYFASGQQFIVKKGTLTSPDELNKWRVGVDKGTVNEGVLREKFPSALAYLFWAFVLARAEVSRVVGVMYLIPPVAMVMAAVVLGSTVSMGVMAGAAIILASVMAMSRVR